MEPMDQINTPRDSLPPLRILSLDGGGIRGISSLLVLEDIMDKIREANHLDRVPRPCEHFDLIGGTSTGGIIAIMLGRLRMTVDECIRTYRKIAQRAFTPKRTSVLPARPTGAFSARALEAAIKQTVREFCVEPECVGIRSQGHPTIETCPHSEMAFRDRSCTNTVVLAITKANIDAPPTLFKTYDTSIGFDECTIWQVARATSAATTFFKPIKIGRDEIEFIDAAFGYSNPCETLIEEARRQFPERTEMRVLSIGTGLGDVVTIGDTRLSILSALKRMAVSSKKVATSLDSRYGDSGQYFRFNVNQGLHDITLSDWEKASEISAHTRNYLSENQRIIKKFVDCFTRNVPARERCGGVTSQTEHTPVPEEYGTRSLEMSPLDSSGAVFTIGFSLSEVTEVNHFVARKEELDRIHKVFSEGAGRRTTVVHGLGGMGKTQLAAEYTKRHRDDYSAVFWLNARDETSLKQGFVGIAERILREYPLVVYLRNAVESRDLNEGVQAVKRWLDNLKNDRWLIVYDNYDNPTLDGHESDRPNKKRDEGIEVDEDGNSASKGYDIRSFFPNTYHGAILITTRSSKVKIGHPIALGKLKSLEDGLKILSHTSNRHDLYEDIAAIELVKELDGLPLALSTAGAYLDNVATTFAEYLRMYRESWLRLQKTTPGLISYKDRALYSTWGVSYAQVKQQNVMSANLLRLWAYFDNEDLWFELLREGWSSGPQWFQELTDDVLGFNEAVRVLCDYGLAEADVSSKERGTESRGYGMHGCVHSWTMHVLNESRDVKMAQLAMRCVASHMPAAVEREYWVLQRRLMRHAGRSLAMVIKNGISITKGDEWVLPTLGDLFSYQGQLSNAEIMYERALRGMEKSLGPEHTSTLGTINNLGRLFADQGRLSDAMIMYERALQGSEKILGPEHTLTLGIVCNIGNLHMDQGRLSDAEAMYKRALRSYEKTLGLEHTLTLNIVNNLGNLYADQDRFSDAEAMYDQALRGRIKALGPDHTSTLTTVGNLGLLYENQGRLSDAEAMYERALRGQEKALGSEHPSTLIRINNLGHLYVDQGRFSEAEAMYERALRGRIKVLGPEHTLTLDTISNLGNLYKNLGRLSDAEAMCERALRGKEKALGLEHHSTLNMVDNLGLLYIDQGRLSDAETMYQRALRGKEKALGSEHTSTLDTANNLGLLYMNQSRFSEAETMYKRALRGREKTLGSEHTSTLDTVNNLGLLYAGQGRFSEAEAMYKRALKGREKTLGPEHTSTLMTINNLGLLYKNQSRLGDAEAMYKRALIDHTSNKALAELAIAATSNE